MWSVSMIMSITSVVISELIYVCWNKLLPIIWKFNGKFWQIFLLLSYLYISVNNSFLQVEASFLPAHTLMCTAKTLALRRTSLAKYSIC